MGRVLGEIASYIKTNQLVISVAAGVSLKSLEKYLDN
jgi:pyrroline-5-carboxylate reductase